MRAIALCGALFALGGAVAAVATSGADAAPRTARPAAAAGDDQVVGQIRRLQRTTWHWQSVLGLTRSGSSFSSARSTDPAYRVWVRDLWRRRAARLRRNAERYMATRIVSLQSEIDHWRRVMGKPPLRQAASAATREQAYVTWRRLARSVLREASNPPYASAWRCIHRYEGSWTDAGAPVLRRPADGHRASSATTAATCWRRRARPTTGRRSSRCGSRRAPPQRPRLLSVAEHGASLRADLVHAFSSVASGIGSMA